MRGEENPQPQMFSYVDLESRVPKHHPIRKVRGIVDKALAELAGRPLLGDSNDPALDRELSGYREIITGYDDRILYPVGISNEEGVEL